MYCKGHMISFSGVFCRSWEPREAPVTPATAGLWLHLNYIKSATAPTFKYSSDQILRHFPLLITLGPHLYPQTQESSRTIVTTMASATATSTATTPAPLEDAKGILSTAGMQFSNLDIHFRKGEDVIDPDTGVLRVADKEYATAKYPEWLPTWDPKQSFPAYADDFNKTFRDPGLEADPELNNLFPKDSATDYKITKLSPKLGSEVRGIQLSQLDAKGKNDLALYVAQRGVVVFRDQDLKDKGLEFNKVFAEHFGPLHTHASSGAPDKYPQFHITYRRHDPDEYNKVFRNRLSLKDQWHSDCTFETYTPTYTFFAMLDGPETGGDTIFSDCFEAYDRLSPKFKQMLEGLKAVHSSVDQAKQSKMEGGIERRPASTVLHPLVRVHPVLKRKALYLSRFFMKDIEGLKKEESDAILDLLTDHINNSFDMQIRARYEPGTVVVWDNRRVLHTATFDWDTGATRHCYRITPMGERAVETEEELEDWNK